MALPAARLLPAPGSTSAISRRSPAATSAPGCRRCSARWSCVDTKARTGRPGQAAARPSGGPRPGPPPAAPVTSTSPLTEHSSASMAASPTTQYLSEVDTCKNIAYRCSYEALRASMHHRQSPGRRRRTVEPPARAGADSGPAPLPRPRHRPAGHPQQRPGSAPEGPAGRRRHHPAHPPGTDRRDRVRADRGRPGAAARTQRAAGLGPALRTGTVPGRRGPAQLGTAGQRQADRAHCPPGRRASSG